MNKTPPDDSPHQPHLDTPTTPAAYPFGHLIPADSSGPSADDAQRERDRRAGRGRKNWWEKYLREDGA